MDVGIAPDALRRIRAEHTVDPPGIKIVNAGPFNRLGRDAHSIERLVVLAPADRADPTLVVEVDCLTPGGRFELRHGPPAQIGVVKQHIGRIGYDRIGCLAVDRIVIAGRAQHHDRFTFHYGAKAVPLAGLEASPDPQSRRGRLFGKAILVDQFEPITDIGIGRYRLRLGLGGSATQQGGKENGETRKRLMHFSVFC